MIRLNKVKLSRLNSTLDSEYDVFICSSSFESRSLLVAQKIRRKKLNKILILENKHGGEKLKENTNSLLKFFPSKGKILPVNFDDPLGIADKLSIEIGRGFAGRKISVLLDITTFTHETLMICMKILSLKKNISRVTCVYVNAEDYCPGVEPEKKWLSRGCKELHSVLGYSGMLLPSQKDRLIVIVGYEHHRATDVILSYEPNGLTLVYGTADNATTEKNKDANKLFYELVQDMSFEYSDVESITIPCDDPDATADILCDLYEKHPDENLIIIPMNNKLSTIGVVKSLLRSQEVQACYAPAIVYNEENYSSPGNNCYIYDYTNG